MSPIASHRKQTLVINYTDATGATGTLNFELMAYRALDAQETIAAKKSPVASCSCRQTATNGGATSIGRPSAIKSAWDAQAAQNAQAAQKARHAASAQPGQVLPAERSTTYLGVSHIARRA